MMIGFNDIIRSYRSFSIWNTSWVRSSGFSEQKTNYTSYHSQRPSVLGDAVEIENSDTDIIHFKNEFQIQKCIYSLEYIFLYRVVQAKMRFFFFF